MNIHDSEYMQLQPISLSTSFNIKMKWADDNLLVVNNALVVYATYTIW